MKFGKAGIYIRILIPALMIYALVSMFVTGGKLEKAERQLRTAQEQVSALERENEALEKAIEQADDPEVLAQQARQELGLVLPGDKLIYDLGN